MKQRDLPQDLRAEAERRLQLAQSGTLNGSIATAYALLAIHNTLIKIEERLITLIKIEEHLITLIKIEEHLISAMGRETQAPSPASVRLSSSSAGYQDNSERCPVIGCALRPS